LQKLAAARRAEVARRADLRQQRELDDLAMRRFMTREQHE